MRNVLTIFKSDMRRLSRSFWGMVIIAACMLLPAMYAWVNIYANWDPYGNTGGVKIAVVSNDKDYVTDDGTVKNVGNDVVESLRAKTSIGWQFLDDETQALDGVYDGTYYAAIIIDEDFTYNMYNFLTTDMTQPTIRYYVNSKTNAIATKITDTAASTIKSTVNENYLKVIIETIFGKINSLYANVESQDPVSALEDVLNNVNNNLKDYSRTLGAFTRAGNMLTNDLASMGKTVDYAIYTINQSRDHISDAVTNLDETKQELAAVNSEVDSSLKNISNLLQKAIDQMSGKDIATTTDITATMEQLEKQYNELISYLETRGGETDPAAADALSALKNNLAEMEALRKSLGLNSNFSTDDQAYLNMVDETEAITKVKSDFDGTVVPSLYKVYVDPSADSVLEENSSSVASLQNMSEFILSDVSSKLDSIDANIAAASSASDPAVAAQAMDDASADASDAAGELQALSATYTSLTQNVSGYDDAGLAAASTAAADSLTNAANSLATNSLTLPTIDLKTMLEANKLAVDVVRETLTQDVYPALDGALDNLQWTLGDMSSVLMNAADVLTGSKDVLNSLANTVQTLNSAFYQMQNVLNNISGQLTDLLQKIDDLKNDEKIQTLLDFFGLDPDAIGSFLAQPVETVTEAVYPVENYGSGMTPFYSTLAVWVGSVILCAILKAEADSTVVPDPKMWQMFFGRYLTFFVFAQLQGLVIVLGDMFLLGCQCLHPWLFIIAGSVTAFSFSLLIYALTVSFGDVGKAIVVVIMILQIAGSSGSFPIELLPEFFQKAYVFFPFPYAINAMRECIAGLYHLDYVKYLLDLMIFVGAALFIGLVIRKPFVGLNEYIEEKMEDTELLK
jgi:putative membrane protein